MVGDRADCGNEESEPETGADLDCWNELDSNHASGQASQTPAQERASTRFNDHS